MRNYTSRIVDAKLLGFAGYKVGMGHAIVTENYQFSPNFKGKMSVPFTVIECPPVKVVAVALYTKDSYGMKKAAEIRTDKYDKDFARKVPMPKKAPKAVEIPKDLYDVRLLVHTQPRLVELKKKPELFELAIGGKTVNDRLTAAQALLGKEVTVKDVFADGNLVDIHAITKGHGIQGPVKRFGVSLRSHKSEKTKRGPGNVGGWTGNRSWTVSHAGQTGYHQRFQHNSYVLKVGEKGEEVTPKGGFAHYGIVKNHYLLLKGSVAGPQKRLIRLTHAIRPTKFVAKEAPKIETLVV